MERRRFLLTSMAGPLASPLRTGTILTLTSLFLAGCAPAIKPDATTTGWILWSMRFSGGNPWAEAKFDTREECAVEWSRRAEDADKRGLRAYHDVKSLAFTMRENPHAGFMLFVCMDARRDPTRP